MVAVLGLDKFQILAPPAKFAEVGVFIANTMLDTLSGAWFFNRIDANESLEEAARRCSWNWAPGASNQSTDRQWPGAGGAAIMNVGGFGLFRNDQPLVTRLPDWNAAGGCFFALACSADTTIGATSNDRASICGTYGDNTNRGFHCEMSVWSTGTIRLIDYAAGAPATPVTNSVVTAANDLAKWRIYFGRTGPTLKMQNMQGDGSAPNPTETTLSGGRAPGLLPWAVGGRIGPSGAVYTPAITKKIAFVLRFNSIPDAGQLTALQAQCADIAAEIPIVPLATTP